MLFYKQVSVHYKSILVVMIPYNNTIRNKQFFPKMSSNKWGIYLNVNFISVVNTLTYLETTISNKNNLDTNVKKKTVLVIRISK